MEKKCFKCSRRFGRYAELSNKAVAIIIVIVFLSIGIVSYLTYEPKTYETLYIYEKITDNGNYLIRDQNNKYHQVTPVYYFECEVGGILRTGGYSYAWLVINIIIYIIISGCFSSLAISYYLDLDHKNGHKYNAQFKNKKDSDL